MAAADTVVGYFRADSRFARCQWETALQSNVVLADSRFARSQWETALQSNVVFHWLSASLESVLSKYYAHCSYFVVFLVW